MSDLQGPKTEADLEDLLSAPTPETIEAMSQLGGDLLILGAGGKMGPSLAQLAKRSLDAAGTSRRVICVSQFRNREVAQSLRSAGIEVIAADLLDRDQVASLPDAPNVIYLAGMKFGTSDSPSMTWAMNTYAPALCGERYRDARIVALSTGNVYALVSPDSGGCSETQMPAPVGEYAQSCLGRERIFEYMAARYGTEALLVRLFYAHDLRYGVITDIAQQVYRREPIDLSMGWFNAIWQGDANAILLRSFEHCANPTEIINLHTRETLSVRDVATRLAELMELPRPTFCGSELPRAFLGNGAKCFDYFGEPRISVDTLIDWTAQWVKGGGRTLGKPTHFQARDGVF